MRKVIDMKQLFVLLLLPLFSKSQRGFEPATIEVDRNWLIPESTLVGTIVKTVRVKGENTESVQYTLDVDDNIENPFWIDPTTGYVYLNKSLEGKVSQRFLFVTTLNNINIFTLLCLYRRISRSLSFSLLVLMMEVLVLKIKFVS